MNPEPQMGIQGKRLRFLVNLFRQNRATLETHESGFGFRIQTSYNTSEYFPIEIREHPHWDNSLNQTLAYMLRTAIGEGDDTPFIYEFVEDNPDGGMTVECGACGQHFYAPDKLTTELDCPSCKTRVHYPEGASF